MTTTTRDERAVSERRGVSFRTVLGLLITAAAAWFIIGNNGVVRVHLWVTWVSARMWVVLLVTFLAGALAGYLFAWRRRRRRD